MDIVINTLAFIVAISILVTVHEWGHYYVARLCNVKVIRFSIGFGKSLFSYRGKPPVYEPPPDDQVIETRDNQPAEGTEFVIAAIPLGGYVKMLDEREGYVADDQLHLAFNRKPVLQRMAIVLAGPIANFLLAIVAYWLLFTLGIVSLAPVLGHVDPESPAGLAGLKEGQEIIKVDGEEVGDWSQMSLALFNRIGESGDIEIQAAYEGETSGRTYRISIEDWLGNEEAPNPAEDLGLRSYPTPAAVIGRVLDNEPAGMAGLQAGDRVIRINGKDTGYWYQFQRAIEQSPGDILELTVLRDSSEVSIAVTPRVNRVEGIEKGYLGVGADVSGLSIPEHMWRTRSYPFYSAWIPAIEKTWSITLFTVNSMKKMLTGALSPKNLGGPITIARVAGNSVSHGLESFIYLLALLSISLGVINLLPVPVLDGGHFLYFLIELIRGKPVPDKVQEMGLQLGMVIIIGLMGLVFFNDFARL